MPQRLQMMSSSRSSSTSSWTRSSETLQLMTSFWSLEISMRAWEVMRPTGKAFWAFMEWEKKIQMVSFCYPNVHSTSWQSLARCSGKRTNTRLPGNTQDQNTGINSSYSCAAVRYSGCAFHSRYERGRMLGRPPPRTLKTLHAHKSIKADQRTEHS